MVHSTCSQVLERTREQELSEDLLAIIIVFVASNNGRRAAENRRKSKNAKKPNDARKMRKKEKLLKKTKILITIKKVRS